MVRIFRTIFKEAQGSLEEIKEIEGGFSDEKEMQALIEESLAAVFPDHKLVKHEFGVARQRIDTVAFNVKTRSFVLIEYKKNKEKGAVEQATGYLQMLNERKEDFVGLLNKKNLDLVQSYREIRSKGFFSKEDIAWDKSKAVIISPSFPERQLYAAEASKYTVELHQITKYRNGVMALEEVSRQKQEGRVSSKKKEGGEEVHLTNASNATRDLYDVLKTNLIDEMHDLKIMPMKISIKMLNKRNKTVCDIEVQKNTLNLGYVTNRLNIEPNDRSFVRRMIGPDGKKIGKRVAGNYMSKIKSQVDVPRAIQYVKQVYDKAGNGGTSSHKKDGVAKTKRQYDEEEYLDANGSDATKALYRELQRELRVAIPGAKSKTTKRYINWYSPKTGVSFCTVSVLKKSLTVTYNTKQLGVSKTDMKFIRHMLKNGKKISMAGLGEYMSKINNKKGITRAISYIKNVHMQKVNDASFL